MSIIEMPEQQAKAHSDELSFNAQLEGDAVAGTPTLDWPGVGGEGPHDSLAITRKPVNEPQWVIKTDSEVYIDTLEKRLKRAKLAKGGASLLNKGERMAGTTSRLPSNHFVENDDESEYSINTEEPPTMSSETTCLLYDARQQEKERNRYLLKQKDIEERNNVIICRGDQSIDRVVLEADSPVPKSRKASLGSVTGEGSIQPILDGSTRQYTLSPRIQFNDSVRISGGIKSNRERRRVSASSIFTTEPHTSDRNGNKNADHEAYGPNPSPPPQHVQFGTQRGSFSRSSGRVSRAASFLSEDGTATGRSRASTPASIYAPLLLPSKTAPSPSRHFYLTFKRDDGQATYRELVRQQTERKRKKKNTRRRGRPRRRLTKSWHASDVEDDIDVNNDDRSDEDSDEEGYFGSEWCFNLTFWTCGINRLFRRSKQGRHRRDFDEESGDDVHDQHVATTRTQSDASNPDSDAESEINGRQETKSELQVMFGSRPWRYFKAGYWKYRFRGARIHERDEEDEPW